MPPRKKNLGVCNDCDIPFKDNDAWLGCGSCQHWYHRDCTKVSKVQFEALVEAAKEGDDSIKFFCVLCKDTVKDILDNVQRFKKMQIELNKIKTEINERFEKLEARATKAEKTDVKVKNLQGGPKKTELKRYEIQ